MNKVRTPFDNWFSNLTQCGFCYNHLNHNGSNLSIIISTTSTQGLGVNSNEYYCSHNCLEQYRVMKGYKTTEK